MKALGYLISIVSVLLLGTVAWPKADEPRWKAALLATGMAASIAGIGLRYLAHRKEQAAIALAKREAERKG